MIKIGDTLKFIGKQAGSVTIERSAPGYKFLWGRLDCPESKLHGEIFPFSRNGEYMGSSAWRLPDLVVPEIEEDFNEPVVVEEEFTG